jgi:Transposase DDE domain
MGVRWGSFSLYGVKLHMLLCATNRVPISYELSAANVAEVRLTEELLEEASGILVPGEDLARKVLGDLAYQSEASERKLAEHGIALVTERARQQGVRQQVEIAFSSLKRVFGAEETLATTLTGLATRLASKITTYTFTRFTSTTCSAVCKEG